MLRSDLKFFRYDFGLARPLSSLRSLLGWAERLQMAITIGWPRRDQSEPAHRYERRSQDFRRRSVLRAEVMSRYILIQMMALSCLLFLSQGCSQTRTLVFVVPDGFRGVVK